MFFSKLTKLASGVQSHGNKGEDRDHPQKENASQDNNPANDITNPEIGADFLNPDVANTVPATSYRQHTILQTYSVVIQLSGVSLTFLSQDPLEFGVLQNSLTSSSRSITPVFN